MAYNNTVPVTLNGVYNSGTNEILFTLTQYGYTKSTGLYDVVLKTKIQSIPVSLCSYKRQGGTFIIENNSQDEFEISTGWYDVVNNTHYSSVTSALDSFVDALIAQGDTGGGGGTMTAAQIETALDAYYGSTAWRDSGVPYIEKSLAEIQSAIDDEIVQFPALFKIELVANEVYLLTQSVSNNRLNDDGLIIDLNESEYFNVKYRIEWNTNYLIQADLNKIKNVPINGYELNTTSYPYYGTIDISGGDDTYVEGIIMPQINKGGIVKIITTDEFNTSKINVDAISIILNDGTTGLISFSNIYQFIYLTKHQVSNQIFSIDHNLTSNVKIISKTLAEVQTDIANGTLTFPAQYIIETATSTQYLITESISTDNLAPRGTLLDYNEGDSFDIRFTIDGGGFTITQGDPLKTKMVGFNSGSVDLTGLNMYGVIDLKQTDATDIFEIVITGAIKFKFISSDQSAVIDINGAGVKFANGFVGNFTYSDTSDYLILEQGNLIGLTCIDAYGAYTGGAREYVALLSQSGTDAPVATVLKNTLGGAVTYMYDDTGAYIAQSTALFTVGKTSCSLLMNSATNQYKGDAQANYNANAIYLSTQLNDNTPSDELLFYSTFKIQVYL